MDPEVKVRSGSQGVRPDRAAERTFPPPHPPASSYRVAAVPGRGQGGPGPWEEATAHSHAWGQLSVTMGRGFSFSTFL